MSTASFTKLATVSASTKRNPAPSDGKVGAATANLTSLYVCPLMPITPEIAVSYRIQRPGEAYSTFCQAQTDVLEGDILVVGSNEYRVRGVGSWADAAYTDSDFLELVVEKVKGV